MLDRGLSKKIPIPGFADALHTLHALGHPLHLVTSRPESHRGVVTDWLAQQGITIGIGDEDVIAGVWLTGPLLTDEKVDAASSINQQNVRPIGACISGPGNGKNGNDKLKASVQ